MCRFRIAPSNGCAATSGRAARSCHRAGRRLFLHEFGEPFEKNRLSDLVKKYLRTAGIDKPGACHLFRHAMATQMLENGADIRFIQAILGHAQLSTTEIYTHVTIAQLKKIHALTHPAERPRERHAITTSSGDAEQLLASLDAEAATAWARADAKSRSSCRSSSSGYANATR
jgi:integrase/recombinase XerD